MIGFDFLLPFLFCDDGQKYKDNFGEEYYSLSDSSWEVITAMTFNFN